MNQRLEDQIAFQNFADYIRNEKTMTDYTNNLSLFYRHITPFVEPTFSNFKNNTVQEQTAMFVHLINTQDGMAEKIIRSYVSDLKELYRAKKLAAATIRSRLKGIKALFDANEIQFYWKKVNKGLPRPGKGTDRAYTREELHNMLSISNKLVDRVIITVFSSTGIRVGAWDDLTWADFFPFYDSPIPGMEPKVKGMGLRVYSGDAEEYWTHGTPECASYILQYKEHWKKRFGSYPQDADPLIVTETHLQPNGMVASTIRMRLVDLAVKCGLRPTLPPGRKRHTVMIDHGMRKYFNTMLRRAKVDFADKEDMMGHKVGLESSYTRYEEQDFELWPEYQKAIPFLTISDENRMRAQLVLEQTEKDATKSMAFELSEMKKTIQSLSGDKVNSEKVQMSEEKKERILKLLSDNNLL